MREGGRLRVRAVKVFTDRGVHGSAGLFDRAVQGEGTIQLAIGATVGALGERGPVMVIDTTFTTCR